MDAYKQYERWRISKRIGLGNRRLAGMLGDFVYETSSAEDESRRILESLHERGKQVLPAKDLKFLLGFTSEHNRDKRRADGELEKYLSWHHIDRLSKQIVETCAASAARDDADFVENLAALHRMFKTTDALRGFRNKVDHRAPSDQGGPIHFYREDSPVSARAIWGWTEVAASYWTNLTGIGCAISVVTGINGSVSIAMSRSGPLQWPPIELSIHGLRVLQESGIPVLQQQVEEAREEWAIRTRRWNRARPRQPERGRLGRKKGDLFEHY